MNNFFKATTIAMAALSVSACSNNSAADFADAGTTAVALVGGDYVEANPILAPFGPAAPIASLVMKSGAKKALVAAGVSECEADRGISTGSALGASANVATMSGAAMPVALVIGGVVAFVYYRTQNCATDIAPDGTFEVILEKNANGEWVKQ